MYGATVCHYHYTPYIQVCFSFPFIVSNVFMQLLLYYRPVRTKSSSVFHCQLSLAMFCLQSVLIVGVNSTENVTGCVVVAVLLHYFILTSLMWFFAEMAHLLVKTYFVFYKSSYKYLAILSMFCWGELNFERINMHVILFYSFVRHPYPSGSCYCSFFHICIH